MLRPLGRTSSPPPLVRLNTTPWAPRRPLQRLTPRRSVPVGSDQGGRGVSLGMQSRGL